MTEKHVPPDDPLGFIKQCVKERRILWTYHVNMRLRNRSIPRRLIYDSLLSFEIIEAYPEDKYLPSYLVYFKDGKSVYHVLFAVDVAGENVRVVTVYRPDTLEWTPELKRRLRS